MKNKQLLSQIVITGWCLLVIAGQGIFSSEIKWLEYFSVLWVISGILLIEASDAIGLLILTYPAFMCEKHREWAWVQPLLVLAFLFRILFFDSQLSRIKKLTVCLVGVITLVVSLPSDATELIGKLFLLPERQAVLLLARPDASWFTFPLRASIDRALIAMLVTVAVIGRTMFSSHRIWLAWWLSAVIAIVTTLCGVLLPWQKPHHFLGTTNYPFHEMRLFHGPGYNIHFFSLLVIISLPSFFLPVHDKLFYLRLASIGVLPPILFIHQRAFTLSILMILLCSILFILLRHLERGYNPFLSAINSPGSVKLKHVVCLVSGLLLTCAWFIKMGGLDSNSLIRQQLSRRWKTFFTMDAIESSGVILPSTNKKPSLPSTPPISISGGDSVSRTPVGNNSTDKANDIACTSSPPIIVTNVPSMSGVSQDRRKLPLPYHLKNWIIHYDPARGEMWWLCIKTCVEKYLWYGAGAGTWGRFHRLQPRPKKHPYYAHLHNTYLDIMFEYGIIPSVVIFMLCAMACFKIISGKTCISRYWLFYIIGAGVMAAGQHLLYSFSTTVLIFPIFVVIWRAIFT
jgi:hypothetical protein